MDLPEGIAGIVTDLENHGFEVVERREGAWPGGPYIELESRRGSAVRGVRMSPDRGISEVEIRLVPRWWPARRWHDPFAAMRAVRGEARERRALSHDERRSSTLDAVRRLKGTWQERRAMARAEREFERAYTRWAEGKSQAPD